MKATNFSVVSSIASLQRPGSDTQSPEAAAAQAPPPNQRDLASIQKLTNRKDSSVHAAPIRNMVISGPSALFHDDIQPPDPAVGVRYLRCRHCLTNSQTAPGNPDGALFCVISAMNAGVA
jgi:hypothetical protein